MTTLHAVPTTTDRAAALPLSVMLTENGVPREHVSAACEGFSAWLHQHTGEGREHIARLRDQAYPFNAGTVDAQTESARRWAVHYEQVAAEMTRRVQLAAAYLDEMPCLCEEASTVHGLPPFLLKCDRHHLETILSGDE